MTIHADKISPLELGGHNLSEFVTGAVGYELEQWQRSVLERLPTGSITIDFRANLAAERRHYDAWWRAFEQVQERWAGWRRQRLSRMHAAYRRRRR
jgi:hypothetical protein